MLTGTARRSASALAAAAARVVGARAHSATPLTQPLEGLTLPPTSAVAGPPPKTELVTLASGVKVATEDTPVSVGVWGRERARGWGGRLGSEKKARTRTRARLCRSLTLRRAERALLWRERGGWERDVRAGAVRAEARNEGMGGAPRTSLRAGLLFLTLSLPPPHTQGATATLGIYVDAGSVYETAENTGE